MIVVDTSTWIGFIAGENAADVRELDKALADKQVLMAPVVLTELLSESKLPSAIEATLLEIPLAEIHFGYWQRAGALRARILSQKRRARLGDILIAQTCIDHDVALLTRDRDFRAIADSADLRLLLSQS
jgi:predicted nucleic acid-binding protein